MRILANKEIKLLFYKILICVFLFSFISIVLILGKLENRDFYIFICSLCMFILILIICYGYFISQDKIIENAVQQVTEYVSGNPNVHIQCNEEGELYRLFHEVNLLASILNTRTEDEWKTREFLKNTISDISHQLKTPIAALNIYNGILQEETEEIPEIQKFVSLSEQELDRMEVLIQNLLKIAKLDAGTITLDKKPENIVELLEKVKKHFLFRAEHEGKEIILIGDNDITLLCDRSWLIEAIDNIAKNALDHTQEGGTIWIEWRKLASVIQIMIKDNGSGIHPEDLHYIFKRFYRSRFSKDTQGIGLGLPLAKSIIEAHNGTVEVDSKLGRGTTFTIDFLIPTKL